MVFNIDINNIDRLEKLLFLYIEKIILIIGLGFGMIYLSTVLMVNIYFDKKRGLAVGIAVCGSGLGK